VIVYSEEDVAIFAILSIIRKTSKSTKKIAGSKKLSAIIAIKK